MRWLLLLALSIVLCTADEMSCTIHHEGKYYDLNPLKSNQDYEFRTPGDHSFTINVCRRPSKESFGFKDIDDSTVAGFVRLDHNDFSIGAVNTTLSVHDSNVRMTLTGGSRCKLKSGDTELRASTIVDFVCDTSVFGTGEPRLVAQFPPGGDEEACGYFLQWKTHVACPTNEPVGAWGFLASLIFIFIGLALLYFIAGTLYNRYVLRLQGFDQIPRFSLESMRYHASEAVDWFKDLIGSKQYNYRMPEEGSSTPFSSGGNVLPRSTQGTGGLNPVSHHTQASSPESARTIPGSGAGAFVRPYISRTTSTSGKKLDINPVSHQAQAPAATSAVPAPSTSDAPQSPPSAQSQSQPQQQARSPLPAPSASPESAPVKERHRPPPFDLGDDDDGEADSGNTTSAVVAPRQAGAAAQERGRDLGDGGVIRL